MFAPKEQWCSRCGRYVETDIRHNKVGKLGKLVKIVITCHRCRMTLSSKTTSASILEKMEAKALCKEGKEKEVNVNKG